MRGRDYGFKPNRIYGMQRYGATCVECGAAWFKQGLHNSDCEQRPRRIPLRQKVL